MTVAYGEREDRLLMTARQGEKSLSILLTRRITGRMINAMAHVIKQSSPQIEQTPVEMRDDVVMLEHLKAIGPVFSRVEKNPAQLPTLPASSKQAGSAKPIGHLVIGASLGVRAQDFLLVFRGEEGPLLQARVNRSELHRILEILKRRAEVAGWNIAIETAWLQGDSSEIVLN